MKEIIAQKNTYLTIIMAIILVMQLFQLAFAEENEVTYQQFTNALERANQLIAENKFRELPNILPELEEGNLLLYINDPKTGINHGWNYYYIKQIIFNKKDGYYQSAEFGDEAITLLEMSKLPVRATNENLINKKTLRLI